MLSLVRRNRLLRRTARNWLDAGSHQSPITSHQSATGQLSNSINNELSQKVPGVALVSVLVSQSGKHGARDDLKIQAKAPVPNVVEIVLEPVRD